MQKKLTALILLLFVITTSALSQNVSGAIYQIDTTRQVHELTSYTLLYIDSTKSTEKDPIISGERDDQFIPLSDFSGDNKLERQVWLKIELKSTDPFEHWWLIVKTDAPDFNFYSQWE